MALELSSYPLQLTSSFCHLVLLCTASCDCGGTVPRSDKQWVELAKQSFKPKVSTAHRLGCVFNLSGDGLIVHQIYVFDIRFVL
jgi:hypothetical protein